MLDAMPFTEILQGRTSWYSILQMKEQKLQFVQLVLSHRVKGAGAKIQT